MTVGASTLVPTGYSAQRHLVHSTWTGLWWLFALDADLPGKLVYATSSDFKAWSKPSTLTLPAAPVDGRAFSVDLRTTMTEDIVEVALTLPAPPPSLFHVRAVLGAGGVATLDMAGSGLLQADSDDGGAGLDPDIPVTLVTPDGFVSHAAGCLPGFTGGQGVWTSPTADPGGPTWSPGPWTTKGFIISEAVIGRSFVPLAASEMLVFRGVAGNVYSDHHTPAGWGTMGYVVFPFSMTIKQGDNSWSACVTDKARVFRYNSVGLYEHASYAGGTWMPSSPPTLPPPAANSGVFAAADVPSKIGLFVVSATGTIAEETWDGAAWSSPNDTVSCAGGTCTTRSYLAGYSTAVNQRVGLIWTENAANGLAIMGALVCVE